MFQQPLELSKAIIKHLKENFVLAFVLPIVGQTCLQWMFLYLSPLFFLGGEKKGGGGGDSY